MLVGKFSVCEEVYIFFFSNLYSIDLYFQFAWKYIVVSNFMESRRDLIYFIGIMNGDIEIDSQLLRTSQNTLMSVSDSPRQVENASSTKGKRGTNFSVEEDQLLV